MAKGVILVGMQSLNTALAQNVLAEPRRFYLSLQNSTDIVFLLFSSILDKLKFEH